MPHYPDRKVGIVACSGEELPQGTITRLAALKVLEQLRPNETVTICLPLFLAGGEGDRAFARFYPTIAIDGCSRRCAAIGTEMHSGKPAAGIIVDDVLAQHELHSIDGRRRLNDVGHQAVEQTAASVVEIVDRLLANNRSSPDIEASDTQAHSPTLGEEASCSCATDIPVGSVMVAGVRLSLVGLPLILEQASVDEKDSSRQTAKELLDEVRIYNDLDSIDIDALMIVLLRDYETHLALREKKS